MQPEDRDIALLWDIREAARDIEEFIKEATWYIDLMFVTHSSPLNAFFNL